MARRKFYYKLEEAEELRQTFTSWINKVAHVGNGQLSILKDIVIKPKRTFFRQPEELKTFYVEFHFNNAKAIDASHFLISNGLKSAFPQTTNLRVAYKQGN